jgi:hypothetical protein
MVRRERVGLVTVTYNSENVLDGFLSSVFGLNFTDFLLYVVDNASSDGTMEKLNNYKNAQVKVIKNSCNLGVAEANNQGIKLAIEDKCQYVLLINNDTEFEANLVQKLISRLEANSCDMAVPKIKYWDDKDKIWCAGGYFRKWAAWQSWHYGYERKDCAEFSVERIIDYSPTCCMLIKTEVFDKVGLMDKKYFVYWDDTDFCLRALRAGVKMLYAPDIEFYHKVSSLTGHRSNFSIRYLTRNFVYFIKKNLGISSFFWIVLYFCYLSFKFVTFQDDYNTFTLKRNAFYEGLRL